ncbi:MAG: creatininase family protein [Nannocystaceae bacterium]
MNDRTAHAHQLGALTYPDVEAILALPYPKVALIPVGSTEAHGPHLPLQTDSLISEAMAGSAADLLATRGVETVVFPTLHYAVTDWAGAFVGSVSISAETATRLMLETCLAAHKMGFDRVAFMSGHLEPGHVQTMREVVRRYHEATGEALVFPDKTRRRHAEKLTAEFRSGSCHAGQYETSLVLATRPELVRRDIATKLPEHVVPMHIKIREGAQDFLECGMDRAYCGNPAAASTGEGQQTIATLAELVADAVQDSLAT